MSECRLEFEILKTWDNKQVDHDPVNLRLTSDPDGCRLHVKAPYFGSPPPPSSPPGKPCPELWDYEVVEAFFLNEKDQYVEVELCPHGQHLVLILNGRRNIVQEQLPLDFQCSIKGDKWEGSALVPTSYLPPSPTRFNAFAIHGDGDQRTYEALYPATEQHSTPDFHRLEYFKGIDLGVLSPTLCGSEPSKLWNQYSTCM